MDKGSGIATEATAKADVLEREIASDAEQVITAFYDPQVEVSPKDYL